MPKITPFLWFDNQAEDAASLYVSVFKNSKIVSTMPGQGDSVMGVTVDLDGERLILFNGGPGNKLDEACSLFVSCDSQDEIDDYWNKLTADGGRESRCGWLEDKFGLSWQIVPSNLSELLSKPGARESMLKMSKLSIEGLQNA